MTTHRAYRGRRTAEQMQADDIQHGLDVVPGWFRARGSNTAHRTDNTLTTRCGRTLNRTARATIHDRRCAACDAT